MSHEQIELLRTPRPDDLGLKRLGNQSGFQISLLPNGAVFAMEHVLDGRRVMVNRSYGSPVAGSMGRLYLRLGGAIEPGIVTVAGAEAKRLTPFVDLIEDAWIDLRFPLPENNFEILDRWFGHKVENFGKHLARKTRKNP